jgi:hypothetical protein
VLRLRLRRCSAQDDNQAPPLSTTTRLDTSPADTLAAGSRPAKVAEVPPAPLLPPPPSDAPLPARLRRSVRTRLLTLIGTFAIAWSGMWVGEQLVGSWFAPALEAAASNRVVALLTALIAVFIVILVHELGHVFAGHLQGFRLHLLVVGPLRIERKSGVGRLTVGFNHSLQLAGGVAACAPVEEHDLVRRMQWFIAGGPLASLLLAGTATLISALFPVGAWSFPSAVIALTSSLIALVTMIPAKTGNFATDGRRFLQLRRDGPVARRDAMQMLLTVRESQGMAVADVPAEWVAATLEPVDGSMHEVMARATAYGWLLQRGAADEARAHLARAMALTHGMPFGIDAMMAGEAGFVAAFIDGDAAAARAAMAPHEKAIAKFPAYVQARYAAAVSLAEGDESGVRAQVAAARAAIDGLPKPVASSVMWTTEMADRIEGRLLPSS